MKRIILAGVALLVAANAWSADFRIIGISPSSEEVSVEYSNGATGIADFINEYGDDGDLSAWQGLTFTLLKDYDVDDSDHGGELYFSTGDWEFVGGSHKVLNVDSWTKDQIYVDNGASVGIVSGDFELDPTKTGCTIAAGSEMSEIGGRYVVSAGGGGGAPKPQIELAPDDAFIREAMATNSAYAIAYAMTLTASSETLAEYGSWKVNFIISNEQAVATGASRLALKEGAAFREIAGPEGAPATFTVYTDLTLNQAMANFGGCVKIAFADLDGSLKGNTFLVRAQVASPDGQQTVSKTISYIFKDGYFGPAAPEGGPLPVTGKDVVGYFKFDDSDAWGKNAGMSASALTALNSSAAWTANGRRGGGAILLSDAEARITGTLESLHDWSAVYPKYKDADKPQPVGGKILNHLDGSNSWTVAFWYKPNQATKPTDWDALVGALDTEWRRLYDGGWHHLAITFNAREWGESRNAIEIFCDGGHLVPGTNELTQASAWNYSYHGTFSQTAMPAVFNAATGAFSLGGDIVVGGMTVPFVGTVDELVVLNRWMAPEDAKGLYETSDVYVYRTLPDELDGQGMLNSYKRGNCKTLLG